MNNSYIKAVYCLIKNKCTLQKYKHISEEEFFDEKNYGHRSTRSNRF